MTKFLTWLKSLFIHSSEEKTEMTDQVVDIPAITPTTEVKAGVTDFETALKLVEDGVVVLGEAAKDELVALAKKYL
ncbi:hypothetical protein VH86_03975 [Pantoea sp. BL1]|uniref:hypothetical protein n=1 Tax=Pantoea sp. BL1 TaxID=1628190 RepID=UPI0005F85A1E|nr:hypothetical protein [Pantoea sp. BL1]KJV49651.1 hypothetical protein VH86_03975 [Pantoea sp. BL1]